MVLPKACNIMLNDGTYLYNSIQVFDYLLSLGFAREDLEDTLACELDNSAARRRLGSDCRRIL